MALQAIAYTSAAASDVDEVQIREMIVRAGNVNRLAGVTGVLLFDGSRFLQYFEGPDDGIALVYSRVRNSRFHVDMVELARGRVSQRRMPYWPMHWLLVANTQLREATFSDWTSLKRRSLGSRGVPTGLDRLAALAEPHLQ